MHRNGQVGAQGRESERFQVGADPRSRAELPKQGANMSRSVYEDRFFEVIAPESPLNCRDDGGHLILIKKEPVTDRSDLTHQEAVDFMRISMAVGRAMYDVLQVERMNYEDLGNWSVDERGGPKMHLHFFWKSKRASPPDARAPYLTTAEGPSDLQRASETD